MMLSEAIRELISESTIDTPLTAWQVFENMPNVCLHLVDSVMVGKLLCQMYRRGKIKRVKVCVRHGRWANQWGFYV